MINQESGENKYFILKENQVKLEDGKFEYEDWDDKSNIGFGKIVTINI